MKFKALTQQQFLEKANNVHGNMFDYSLVNYVATHTKIEIICHKHGSFFMAPADHLRGQKCPKCKFEAMKKSPEQFLQEVIKIHGDKYDFSQTHYIDSKTKVVVICREQHGQFLIKPSNLLEGHGCRLCGIQSTTSDTSTFISKAKEIHGDKYIYTEVNYIGVHKKVDIICKKHGRFSIQPNDHLQGSACARCTHRISKGEIEWLNYLKIADDNEHRQVQLEMINHRKIHVDAFDAITNTVYEFLGDYWHGNLEIFSEHEINKTCYKTFGQLNRKTKQRNALILQSGYKLVQIWENDWNKIKRQNKSAF